MAAHIIDTCVVFRIPKGYITNGKVNSYHALCQSEDPFIILVFIINIRTLGKVGCK